MLIDYFFRDMEKLRDLKTQKSYKEGFIDRNNAQNVEYEKEIKVLDAQIELLEMRLKPAKDALEKVV